MLESVSQSVYSSPERNFWGYHISKDEDKDEDKVKEIVGARERKPEEKEEIKSLIFHLMKCLLQAIQGGTISASSAKASLQNIMCLISKHGLSHSTLIKSALQQVMRSYRHYFQDELQSKPHPVFTMPVNTFV